MDEPVGFHDMFTLEPGEDLSDNQLE